MRRKGKGKSEGEYKYPLRDKPAVTIAIPTAIVENIPLLEKTIKLAYVARFATIFRVEEIHIYRDPYDNSPEENFRLIEIILRYAATPPYLKRKLFKRKRALRYAGILPPLKTPDHQPKIDLEKITRLDAYRKGLVVGFRKGGVLVDIGLDKPIIAAGRAPPGAQVSVHIVKRGKALRARIVSEEKVPLYWGFRTIGLLSLRELLNRFSNKGTLTIATSKHGQNIIEVLPKLQSAIKKNKKILVLFGSPEHGLYQIFEKENLSLEDSVNWVVNFVPHQGTETIRTEEAIGICLAIINVLKCS
ncbi:MAG: hypothetical protein DRJ36_00295 [Thermoprotei archaeon]|mgnify:CR=1 FL=1|nr:MAG: hypothetical protein DRJ36_00295 [Thermoprotei archaeon]RLF03577.1 MAG: hypothetical protein DRJ59_00090 [Thermoprotei archaeon]